MRTRTVKEYILSKTDQRVIAEIANLAISNHVPNEDIKLYNILMNESVYTEPLMASILLFLSKIELAIRTKLAGIKTEAEEMNIPVNADNYSLVLRPKEFIEMIISNYRMQLAGINQIRKILTTEVEPDENE